MVVLKEYQEIFTEDLPPEGKFLIRCPFKSCNTRIIPLSNKLTQQKCDISNAPLMLNISEKDSESVLGKYFKIDDVWDFDNIGVSRPSNSVQDPIIKENGEELNIKIERLLVCSECDKGPLGIAGFEGEETDVQKLKYFLSCNSVLYEEV